MDIKAEADLEQMEVDEDDGVKDRKKKVNVPPVADGIQIDLNKVVVI